MAKKPKKETPRPPGWLEAIRSWKLDAAREAELSRYFYEREAAQGLLNGHKLLITGRKGTGKTAIMRYVGEQAEKLVNHHVARLMLQNYGVFGDDPKTIKDQGTTTDLHPHWSLVILTELAKLLIRNPRIAAGTRSQLKELIAKSPINLLRGYETIATERSGQFQLLGHGAGVNISNTVRYIDAEVSEKTRAFADAIKDAMDDAFYYVFIDGIDSNFTPVSNYLGNEYFLDYVSAFIRAAESLREEFGTAGKRFFPIITVRTDIYNQLRHSDKGKWKDIRVELTWDKDTLKDLIDLRVGRAQRDRAPRFETEGSFEGLFFHKTIDSRSLYQHACRLSFLRPRDVVNFVQCVADIATSFPVPNPQVRKVFIAQAEYLKQEIIDEAHNDFRDVEDFLLAIEQAGKETVNYQLIRQMFTSESGIANEEAIELAVRYNILGVKRGNKVTFAYEDPGLRPLSRYDLVVHPGLEPLLSLES